MNPIKNTLEKKNVSHVFLFKLYIYKITLLKKTAYVG